MTDTGTVGLSVYKLPPGLATRVERTLMPAARYLAVANGPGTNSDNDECPLAHSDPARAIALYLDLLLVYWPSYTHTKF